MGRSCFVPGAYRRRVRDNTNSDTELPMDIAEKVAEIEALRRDSRAKMTVLMRHGLNDVGLGEARLEMFIEALMPWDGGANEARVEFEHRWETMANQALGGVVEQIGRAKLLEGVSVPRVNGN